MNANSYNRWNLWQDLGIMYAVSSLYATYGIVFPMYAKYVSDDGIFDKGEYVRFYRPIYGTASSKYLKLRYIYKRMNLRNDYSSMYGYAEYYSCFQDKSATVNIEDLKEVTYGEVFNGG